MHVGQLDGRLAWDVEQLARWWTQATQEARFGLIRQATQEGRPSWQTLRVAILLAEIEAGEIDQG